MAKQVEVPLGEGHGRWDGKKQRKIGRGKGEMGEDVWVSETTKMDGEMSEFEEISTTIHNPAWRIFMKKGTRWKTFTKAGIDK